MKRLLWLYLSCFFTFSLHAQKWGRDRLDSLFHMLQRPQRDSMIMRIYKDLSFTYSNINPDSGIDWGMKALKIAQGMNWLEGQSMVTNSIGANYVAKGDFGNALIWHHTSLGQSEAIRDTLGIARSLGNIGCIYKDQGNYPKAQQYFLNALRLNEKKKFDIGIAFDVSLLGMIYEKQQDYKNAMAYHYKALAANARLKDSNNIAIAMGNIGNVFNNMQLYDSALFYLKGAFEINARAGNKNGMAVNKGNIGNVYENLKAYPEALSSFQESLRLNTELTDMYGVLINKGSLGRLYAKQYAAQTKKQPLLISMSVNLLSEAIESAKALGDKSIVQNFSFDLSEAYSEAGNCDMAYAMYKQSVQYRDSIYNEERNLAIIKQESDFKLERQQMEMAALRKESQVVLLTRQRQLLAGISIIGLLLLLGAIMFYRSRLNTLKIKKELAEELAKQELRESEFKSKMNELVFTALRAQMNPHFIFNCLNSIKLYTEQNDSIAASEYLTKFSRLIRKMLENARSETIILSSETELIRLYLEMETMRFKERFQYKVEVDANVDSDFIEIPPMLIQPFVENAIWHGLMYREEAGGNLAIHIMLDEPAACLIIKIKDNGIGRKASSALKKGRAGRKSYGISLSEEQLHLYNEKYKSNATIEIEDLYYPDKTPAGTLVTINFPLL